MTRVVVVALWLMVAGVAAPPAQAQKFKVLYTFHGPNGFFPAAQLTRDAGGNLYGTTEAGGSGSCKPVGCGTAFKLDKNGKQVWLHSFNGKSGMQPMAGFLRGTAGNLYGTTVYGGDAKCNPPYGCGTVFKLSKTGKETELYKFTGQPDGAFPEALLIQDAAKNLYGTTIWGGDQNYGTVFRLDASGAETVLHIFGWSDGAEPFPGVITDAGKESSDQVIEPGTTPSENELKA